MLRKSNVKESCKNGNEPSGPIKCDIFQISRLPEELPASQQRHFSGFRLPSMHISPKYSLRLMFINQTFISLNVCRVHTFNLYIIHTDRCSISEKSKAFNSFQCSYSLKTVCYQHDSLSCNNC